VGKVRFANMPMIVKIAFAPSIALIMMAAIAGFAIVSQRQSSAALRDAVDVGMTDSLKVQRISERITETHGRLYMLLTHQAGKIEAGKLAVQTKELLADYTAIHKDILTVAADAPASEKPAFVKLAKQLDETKSAVDLVGSMMTADFSTAASFIAPFEQSYQQMTNTLATVVKATQDSTNARAAASETLATRSERIMIIAVMITLVAVAALALASVFATRNDIRKIADATEMLASGNAGIDLKALERKDELGAIVRSLTVFRDNQLRIIKMRKEKEETDEVRAAEQAKLAKQQTSVVASLAEGMDHLAAGDLSFRVTAEFPEDYRALREDFNGAMAQLDETVRTITDVTAAMQAETGTTNTGAANANDGRTTLKETGEALVQALDAFRAHQQRMDEMTREHAALQEARAKEQTLVVSNLDKALDHLAAGNLTYRMTANFPGEYAALRDNFNGAMGRLEETLYNIWQVTAVIKTGTGEISQASDNLSQRTEHQAASLEETAAALDEITTAVRSSAEGAADVRKAVAGAKSDAVSSSNVVADTAKAMEDIKTSSIEINQIVGAIDEIAFQTNLLSLNAGIEAARAGDAGRGFAVVATEVRSLAQRSAQMAKQIKTLIGDSNDKVNLGVGLVAETGKSLERIATQVISIDKVIEQIAGSTKEQSTGLEQINASVNDMDSVTQQNAAMVQETTSASHSLAGETEELVNLLGQFKVNGVDTNTNAVAPAVEANKILKVANGSPVSAPPPDEGQKDWEEF
jgi:methyl-accepting chemotaxis protein